MSDKYQITRSCFRYIVPFTFDMPFDEAYRAVDARKMPESGTGEEQNGVSKNGMPVWIRRQASFQNSESDVYEYIRNEFRFEDAREELHEEELPQLPKEKSGCEWLYRTSAGIPEEKWQDILEFEYFPQGMEAGVLECLPEKWKLFVRNLGLILFRNNLGFLWYELSVPISEIDTDQLKEFQFAVKELNCKKHRSYLWQECQEKPEHGVTVQEEGVQDRYFSKLVLGEWLADQVEFLNAHFMAERISFNRPGRIIPDKALLFTYCALEEEERKANDESDTGAVTHGTTLPEGDREEWDRKTLSYHLTNGYKDSYHFSSEVAREMKKPFENVVWYATQEGVSYLAWPATDNKRFFERIFIKKIWGDYFNLYIKALYQSFSLLLYAQRIEKELSARKEEYIGEPADNRISDLFCEISLFLTKSMATSVSNIHHQSEFYVYIKSQLRIREDVDSVTAGLNALEILQREQRTKDEREKQNLADVAEGKRDSRMQAIMGLLSILAIFSALNDWRAFAGEYVSYESFDAWIVSLMAGFNEVGFYGISYLIILGVGIVALIVTGIALVRSFKKERKEKR